MGGGEGVLHQVLAEVTGAAHQVGKPDQREPLLSEGLLEPGRYRLRLIHNQYVVSVTANVAPPRTPTMTRDRTRVRSWVVARRLSLGKVAPGLSCGLIRLRPRPFPAVPPKRDGPGGATGKHLYDHLLTN